MSNEDSSTENLSKVSKSPENKPAMRKWAKSAINILLWFFAGLSNLERIIKTIARFIAWLREMLDAS